MNEKEEIAVNSIEYMEMFQVIMKNKPRTSRDILCAKCWKMQSFWQHKRHLQFYEDHAPFTINAKIYMIEEKFLETARNAGALRIDEFGVQYIKNPLRVIGERQNTIRFLQKKFKVKKDVYDDLKQEPKDVFEEEEKEAEYSVNIPQQKPLSISSENFQVQQKQALERFSKVKGILSSLDNIQKEINRVRDDISGLSTEYQGTQNNLNNQTKLLQNQLEKPDWFKMMLFKNNYDQEQDQSSLNNRL